MSLKLVEPPGSKPKAKAKGTSKRKPAAKAPKSSVDLYDLGARVVSVFGARSSRVLIEMPAEAAAELFPEPLEKCGHMFAIEAAERDIKAIRKRDKDLADSSLAASMMVLAYEMDNPYNSSTSKSMCGRENRDTRDRLLELAPKDVTKDRMDDISARRAARLTGA